MATLFNNHPYISSSVMPVGTKFTATYVGMVAECGHVMEPAYNCMCAWTSCLCTLSASARHAFLHEVDFFLEIFLFLLRGASHAIAVDASSPGTRALTNGVQPQSESASGKSQLRSKQSSKGTSPENFVTIGGCFERYTYMYRVTAALGCLKKEKCGSEQF